MAVFKEFIGPAFEARSVRADSQRLINLYPEPVGNGEHVLYNTPGLATFCTLPSSPVRGLWAGENRLFAVAGSHLYEIASNGGVTDRGAVGGGTGLAQVFPNGSQLAVVAGGYLYVDTGTTIVQVQFDGDTEYVSAAAGAFLDGYFIVIRPSTKNIAISALNDGLTWDALDDRNKEAYPDNALQLLADHEDLWIFGSETTEVWRNTGAADFPLERDPGAFVHMGIAAAQTAVRLAGGVGWLGKDARGGPVAYRAQGYVPKRVSTHAVEYAWSLYSTVTDAEAFAYQEHGHEFWQINFPTGNASWVYDANNGLWHQRAYGSGLDRSRARVHAYQYGKHLVGDHTSGVVYALSSNTYTDGGTAVRRIRRAAHVNEELRPISYSSLKIDHEYSASLTHALSWSDDGGVNFSTPRAPDGFDLSHGTAARKLCASWRRLGAGRDRVFEYEVSGNARVAIHGAYLNAGISWRSGPAD